jgi:hypothetical protein
MGKDSHYFLSLPADQVVSKHCKVRCRTARLIGIVTFDYKFDLQLSRRLANI